MPPVVLSDSGTSNGQSEPAVAPDRGGIEGREMGMLLSIKTDSNTITVIEKRVKPCGETNDPTLQ